ncbi:FAD-dependent monooxygenase [Agreia sp.]|uniref:FAD-dependent monooxygenase n=1 Tax=Agreia sp. TaxID=1872416 RepID=UPI0035BB9F46
MARVLVIGGGIGGLFAARRLASDQHQVTVVERASEPVAIGAGLILPGESIAVLERAGVKARSVAQPLSALQITGPDGRPRAAVANRFSLSRPDLAAALLDGLHNLVDLRYGCTVREFSPGRSEVDVVLGTTGESFDFVVGADGIRSQTRSALSPAVSLRSSGQVCWRGIVDGARGDVATEMWDGFHRVGVVPLRQQRNYVYIVQSGTENTVPREHIGLIGGVGTRRETEAITAMQDLHSDKVLFHELWELSRPFWGSGRVVLIGDAAHAITPNLGLGAALAIEDGDVLTLVIRKGAEHAIRRYRTRRTARVHAIQLASRAIGMTAHSNHRAVTFLRHHLGLQAIDTSPPR